MTSLLFLFNIYILCILSYFCDVRSSEFQRCSVLTTSQVNEKITFHADCLDSKFFCVNVPQYTVQYSTLLG